ncbi:MAG: AtpZ/AtpI family protein [Actinomycetota bacterium]
MSSTRSRFTEHANQTTGSYELALAVVVFGLFGWWLDRRLDSTPWLLIVFTVLGFVGAGLSIYYRYRAQIAHLQEEAASLRAQAVARGADSSVTAEGGQS